MQSLRTSKASEATCKSSPRGGSFFRRLRRHQKNDKEHTQSSFRLSRKSISSGSSNSTDSSSSLSLSLAAPPSPPDCPHWYECEREHRDGTILPRNPSVVPTCTVMCNSYTCVACDAARQIKSVKFEDVQVTLASSSSTTSSATTVPKLPRCKRRWWETSDGSRISHTDESRHELEERQERQRAFARQGTLPRKKQKLVHREIPDTPVHWALQFQGWVDSTLGALDDALMEDPYDDDDDPFYPPLATQKKEWRR